MDIEAKPIGNDIWLLSDLLGRKVVTVTQTSRDFVVDFGPGSILHGLDPHALHKTFGDALSAIKCAHFADRGQ